MKQHLTLLLALLAFTAAAYAQPSPTPKPPKPVTHALDVKPSADGKSFTITPNTIEDTTWGLIELINAKTGNVERVLHAGRISLETSITFTPDAALNLKNDYLIRMRDGISIAFDKSIPRPDSPDGKWVSPSHVLLQNGFLYIGEAGAPTPDLVPKRSPELTWNTRDGKTVKGVCTLVENGNANIIPTDLTPAYVLVDPGTQSPAASAVAMDVQKQTTDWRNLTRFNQPFVVKLRPDGTTAPNWGDRGYWRDGPWSPGNMAALAVDDGGSLYAPARDVTIDVAGPLGMLEKRTVGLWAAPRSVAVAGPTKIYSLPVTSFQRFYSGDRTKTGEAANLLAISPFRNASVITNCMAADAAGNIYFADAENNLVKCVDTDKAIEEKYLVNPEPKLFGLGGVSLSKNLIWAVAHGPGPGPFWDSGGGGEIALFHDNGKALTLLARYGTPGQNTEQLEFLNPRSIVMTPDHKYFYLAEDGAPNSDGPPGNARVSRFTIKAILEDAIPLPLTK